MIPGIEFPFSATKKLIIPPMSLGALELMQDKLAIVPTLTATDPVAVKTMIDALHLALKRNYPEITRPEVAELIDVGNMGDIFECLMDVGGVKRKSQQRGNVAAESPQAGDSSSPSSAPTPAGPGTTSEST